MIGILAGMGPKSTAPFVEKVVELCQQRYGAKYDMDFPPMMIYSCPTPFYLDRPLDHSAMRESIAAGAAKLACCGVDYIAIPCNVAPFSNKEKRITGRYFYTSAICLCRKALVSFFF